MAESQQSLIRTLRLFWCYLGAHFPRLVKPETWDKQYAAGDWDWLSNNEGQMGHHMIVLGYVLRARSNPRILDVGCGVGPWLRYVKRLGMPYERYLGIDISAEAIKQASPLCDADTDFQAANAEEFTTDERFDAIIFNEVAWYFKDAGATLSRYASYLREGGVLVLSMYEMRPARSMWASVDSHFNTLEKIRVDVQGHVWQVRLLAKRT